MVLYKLFSKVKVVYVKFDCLASFVYVVSRAHLGKVHEISNLGSFTVNGLDWPVVF
jgi:hypothetical protein